ncbi:superfamily I DNA and/or RNA helicase [Bacteroidales bacterium 6E]|nr:superfamily I DNA and/or RNA helicase [Bacteroidales bacterium 6E]
MTTSDRQPIVEFLYSPVVNFAIQQNKIPVIRKFTVHNPAETDLADIRIEITCEPEFAEPWIHHADVLQPQRTISVATGDFRLSARYLAEITERITGEIKVKILSGIQPVWQKSYGIDVLPFDFWNGYGYLPEMMAAFVTPNHPEIARILVAASGVLQRWTGSPSFDGYQSQNPDRVKKQMAAIYEAIRAIGIVYCSPPPGFEHEGQRIRTCDTIFTQKLGTCIDMALLYAGCLEATGLNPLVIVIKGHAFAGCWLDDQTFPDSVNDDVSLLKKRIVPGINEIGLVEAVCMNAGQASSFDEAMILANDHLANEDNFHLFIDICRARLSGIRPLPQRIRTSDGWEIVDIPARVAASGIPDEIIADKPVVPGQTTFTKQKLWERKLLDLSLRNNLLNLRVTQTTIQLISVNLSLFEDALADGAEFGVLPKPAEWEKPDTVSGIYQAVSQTDPIAGQVKHDLGQNRLRSYLSEAELENALKNLYRTSRLSLEENGANTLYLALGFLKWYETPRSETARFAPILLFPVEIVRKSAQKGYVIRSREEETLMNVTLLEMLRQDFGITIHGLDDLPRDESGVDVKKILNTVRHGIMSQTRWDVEEQAFIGNFSFNKFIMWNDIHHNAGKLAQNKVVASLISGKMEWEAGDAFEESPDLDSLYPPADIALPISADSSQLEAICAAVQDKSFILHGPPGTGKSQTITNIIANALYQGKRVLFVAEKMAALSVVQKRLADIGLDPFCLELHSNKARKSTILEQLQKTTEVVRKTSPLEFGAEAERLHSLRQELNKYVESLHRKHPFGFSLFECFDGYSQLNGIPDPVRFDESFLLKLDSDLFARLNDLVGEIRDAGTLCGHPHRHPLAEITSGTYNPGIKSQSLELITTYIGQLEQLAINRDAVCSLLEIDTPVLSGDHYSALRDINQTLSGLPDTPEAIMGTANATQTSGRVAVMARHGLKRDRLRSQLSEAFRKEILQLDAEAALDKWNQLSGQWFVARWLGQNKLAKPIRQLSKTGKVGKESIPSILNNIIRYQKEQDIIDRNAGMLSQLLDLMWNGGECDWEQVIRICDSVIQIHESLMRISNDPVKSGEIRAKLAKRLSAGTKSFRDLNGKTLQAYIESYDNTAETEAQLNSLLGISFGDIAPEGEDRVMAAKQAAMRWKNNLDLLRDWSGWNRAVEKATSRGLLPLIDACRCGHLKNEEVTGAFRKAIYRLGADHIISNDSILADFNGRLFEGKIRQFREKSDYFEALTKAELFSKLASAIPSFTQEASQSSEIGILQRAIRNKGRGLSVRKLFDLVPNLLPRLCPCMLMSPISVAQYFEADTSKFDLVVFDEASQMPTCEAVGAIARGKNVIVVGDPKQMPPTNFFSTISFDEENAEKEDLESILDDCLALSMPSKHLVWHYRSKHESLIAFSNSNYYDNRLLTFPSPDDLATKVSNVHVPGFYDRGKTRQNRFEAQAIADEIIQRLSDPVLSKRSIGIVTFSAAQQNLVDDLLNEALKQRPDLDMAASEATEPIFIKNLENVQGDERDVILFSVGYGPDREGRISLNFGPLNRDGGWRRLNVAVSRARYEMKVFSTLRSDQIDITRTTSEGVAGIRAFLEYSEKGKAVLPQKDGARNTGPRSFEKSVADEIREMGYQVHTGIGCSGYRIDLGIVHPDKPGEYLMGILTDGEMYQSARTARDREVIRDNVLRQLGWNIYRLWSPDWWDDSRKVLADIRSALGHAANGKGRGDSAGSPAPQPVRHSSVELLAGKPQSITQHVITEAREFEVYNTCILPQISLRVSDEFFDTRHLATIQIQVREVIETEAPICRSLLSRRILNARGFARQGTRLMRHLDTVYARMNLKCTKQDGTVVYWRNDQDPAHYEKFRIPAGDDDKRNADELPKEEVAAAMVQILRNQVSLPADDLVRETARLFGFTRVGGIVDQAMRTGIDHAVNSGMVIMNNGRYVMT